MFVSSSSSVSPSLSVCPKFLLQFVRFQLQLQRGRWIDVGGRDGEAEGGGGGEEETDGHHKKPTVEDEKEAQTPEVTTSHKPIDRNQSIDHLTKQSNKQACNPLS